MDKNKFLFSIVIPTYNRESDLDRCLASLAGQTFKDFEVIVCDNGSSDNTKGVAMSYADRININYKFITENSGGPAYPRNLGMKEAVGEWICFLDSDDWYTDNRLEYIANLNLSSIDFLYHDLSIIKNGNSYKIMKCRDLAVQNTYYDYIFNINFIPTSSTCIRRELIQKTSGFSESKDISGLEDFELWLKVAKHGARFKYIPIVLGYYAVGNDNFTYYDERQINRYNALYLPLIDGEKNENYRQKIKAVFNYQIACINIKRGKIAEANKLLMSAFFKGSGALKKITVFRFLIGTASLLKIAK